MICLRLGNFTSPSGSSNGEYHAGSLTMSHHIHEVATGFQNLLVQRRVQFHLIGLLGKHRGGSGPIGNGPVFFATKSIYDQQIRLLLDFKESMSS